MCGFWGAVVVTGVGIWVGRVVGGGAGDWGGEGWDDDGYGEDGVGEEELVFLRRYLPRYLGSFR